MINREKQSKRSYHIMHIAEIIHYDINGKIKWGTKNLHNIVHDEGEIFLLSAAFATNAIGYGVPPTTLYLGLDNRSGLAETNTLASLIGEPIDNGYTRVGLRTDGTGASGQDFYITQPAAYYQAQSKIAHFECNTNDWATVSKLFLATSSDNSGKLIASIALTAPRTLVVGDYIDIAMYIGMSE